MSFTIPNFQMTSPSCDKERKPEVEIGCGLVTQLYRTDGQNFTEPERNALARLFEEDQTYTGYGCDLCGGMIEVRTTPSDCDNWQSLTQDIAKKVRTACPQAKVRVAYEGADI